MFLAFGELMMRLAPPGHLRLAQTLPGRLEATFAGAEANVCASLAMLGADSRYLTALPTGALADVAVATLRGLGVDTRFILRRPGRLGVYFVETGANQRPSTVLYDRDGTSVSLAEHGEYDFESALAGVRWVHITGITPSLSEAAFRATLRLAELAAARDLPVSCDLNFRKKLWRWRPGAAANALARECMEQVLPHVRLLIANEEDAADVLEIHAAGTQAAHGRINAAGYVDVARQIVRRFPGIAHVAVTLRESLSADHNNWGGMLYVAANDDAVFAPTDAAGNYRPYEIRDIVDRVGGGDAFAAGLLFRQASRNGADPAAAIAFAVAASCLKHSIQGDFNFISRAEVEALVAGQASGRVQR